MSNTSNGLFPSHPAAEGFYHERILASISNYPNDVFDALNAATEAIDFRLIAVPNTAELPMPLEDALKTVCDINKLSEDTRPTAIQFMIEGLLIAVHMLQPTCRYIPDFNLLRAEVLKAAMHLVLDKSQTEAKGSENV